MPRCPNGTRKNKKTGKCVPNKSGSSPASKKTASPATKKNKKVVKPKVYLDESKIDEIIADYTITISHKNVSKAEVKKVFSKVYYKPRFKSVFYYPSPQKRVAKTDNTPGYVIQKQKNLLEYQLRALIDEWNKGYIGLESFTNTNNL
jgi:hypothetical protein